MRETTEGSVRANASRRAEIGMAGAVALVAGAGLLLGGGTPALADEGGAPTAHVRGAAVQTASAGATDAGVRTSAQVLGTFAFTQDRVSPVDEIARALGGADEVLCSGSAQKVTVPTTVAAATGSGTEAEGAATDGVVSEGEADEVGQAADWEVSIGGDGLDAQLDATIGELAKTSSATSLMGCTCLGNPADGRATVNADVTGIDLRETLYALGIADGANTITFTCADGYRVSLPLTYVLQRRSLIVYAIDGQPLSASVGGTNQLWLGSTAARYFASDVVSIDVECRDEADVPAAPGTAEAGDAYANRPNVGVLSGAQAGE